VSDIDVVHGKALSDSLGDRSQFLALDVRDEAQWQQVSAHILAERGSLDVLVNNAGITGFENGFVLHDPEHATLADWHAVHATNLDGTFLGCNILLS